MDICTFLHQYKIMETMEINKFKYSILPISRRSRINCGDNSLFRPNELLFQQKDFVKMGH